MPRRDDIHKILVIGSGPIVIGQAAEFDYSGVQACKVLLEEGFEVVLVNSNPATIMTDPEFATATYIEPLLPGPVAKIIEKERPDALLPTLGGQTALNLAMSLFQDGTLERFGVELIGADAAAIRRAEDREEFRRTMTEAGLRIPWSITVESVAALVWSVLALSIGAIVLMLEMIRRGEVSRVASLIYLMPPAVAVQAWLLFGETLLTVQVVGMAITAFGVYLTIKTR